MTTASFDSITATVLHRMENSGGSFACLIAEAYIHADGANGLKLRETFGDLFIKYGATAEPEPTLRECITPMLDQIRALGEAFDMYAVGMNPKTKAWAMAQMSFINGAHALAVAKGDASLAGALTSRAVYMASFGRPAFTVQLEEGGKEAPRAPTSQR